MFINVMIMETNCCLKQASTNPFFGMLVRPGKWYFQSQ